MVKVEEEIQVSLDIKSSGIPWKTKYLHLLIATIVWEWPFTQQNYSQINFL